MTWCRVLAGAALLLVSLGGGDSSANMAKHSYEGDSYGSLVPQDETVVRVDSEDLSFDVDPSLERAQVTATYRLTNPGAAVTEADVAFVLVTSDEVARLKGAVPNPRAAVTLEQTPVPFRVVTDADVLEPALEAWLSARPDIKSMLERELDHTPEPFPSSLELGRRLEACGGSCDQLARWYRYDTRPSKDDRDADRKQAVFAAAAKVIPDEVAKVQKAWSTLPRLQGPDVRTTWLAFHLAFPANATRTVTVHYSQDAGGDERRGVNVTHTYDYLLSPAKHWASFGPLRITIHAPSNARVEASLPLTRDGDTYRAALSGLPDGEFSFGVMSSDGLVLGMGDPGQYLLVLLVVLLSVSVLLSVRLGRAWASVRSRLRRVLLCIFGTGLLVGVADALAAWIVLAALPSHALGIGYAPTVNVLSLVMICVFAGMVTSGVWAARTARRRAGAVHG